MSTSRLSRTDAPKDDADALATRVAGANLSRFRAELGNPSNRFRACRNCYPNLCSLCALQWVRTVKLGFLLWRRVLEKGSSPSGQAQWRKLRAVRFAETPVLRRDSLRRYSVRPVLKHGPRSLAYARVEGTERPGSVVKSNFFRVKAAARPLSATWAGATPVALRWSVCARTRKMAIYAGPG